MPERQFQEKTQRFTEKNLNRVEGLEFECHPQRLIDLAIATVPLANLYGLKALAALYDRNPAAACEVFSLTPTKLGEVMSRRNNFLEASFQPYQFFAPALSETSLMRMLKRPLSPAPQIPHVPPETCVVDAGTLEKTKPFSQAWLKVSQTLAVNDFTTASLFIGGPRWLTSVLTELTNSAILDLIHSPDLTWRFRFDHELVMHILTHPGQPIPVSKVSCVCNEHEMPPYV